MTPHEVTGKLRGEVVPLKEYVYRVPVIERPTLHSLDPDRVNPCYEYPRWVHPPGYHTPDIKDVTEEWADYLLQIAKRPDEDWNCEVKVYLLPNSYTRAKERAEVLSCFVTLNAVLASGVSVVAERLVGLLVSQWRGA